MNYYFKLESNNNTYVRLLCKNFSVKQSTNELPFVNTTSSILWMLFYWEKRYFRQIGQILKGTHSPIKCMHIHSLITNKILIFRETAANVGVQRGHHYYPNTCRCHRTFVWTKLCNLSSVIAAAHTISISSRSKSSIAS